MNFPIIYKPEDDASLVEDSSRILASIETHCTSLTAVMMSVACVRGLRFQLNTWILALRLLRRPFP